MKDKEKEFSIKQSQFVFSKEVGGVSVDIQVEILLENGTSFSAFIPVITDCDCSVEDLKNHIHSDIDPYDIRDYVVQSVEKLIEFKMDEASAEKQWGRYENFICGILLAVE